MCNLYSVTTNQEAIRRLFAVADDRAGNLPPLPAVFPDQMAPIVRAAPGGGRELVLARWGVPGPPQAGAPLVTNLRNPASPFWRRWLAPANRCLVPVNAFCEYADTKPRKTPVWFARDESRPLFAFAGVWGRWRGRARTEIGAGRGRARAVRLPHRRAQRDRRARSTPRRCRSC